MITSYVPTTDRKRAPKGQVSVQNNLSERIEIKTLSEKCEINIKLSTLYFS